jgi:hypothetical protein
MSPNLGGALTHLGETHADAAILWQPYAVDRDLDNPSV